MNAKCNPLPQPYPIRLLIHFFIGCQLLLFSDFLFCQNQEYSIKRVTSREGLPKANIIAILQDSDGFMWLGTEDGLVRYDGYEFKVYRNNLRDTTSIGGNFVNSIAEDEEGNLWVTLSFKGLNKFDKNKEQFTRYDPKDSGIDPDLNWLYLEIMEISDKIIWMKSHNQTTSHYLALNAENGAYYLQQGMAPDRSGTNWPDLVTLHEDSILSIEDKWRLNLNAFEKNLLYKRSPKKYLNPLSHPIRRDFNNIIKDKKGNIWIGTNNGLYQFLPGSDSVNTFFHVPNCGYSLKGNSILSLFEDRSGNIWIGSIDLIILENNKKQFFTIQNTPCKSNLLTTNHVRSILEINDNELLVGLTDFGVNHLQLNPLQLHGTLLSNNTCWTMAKERDSSIWIDTRSKWIENYNPYTGFHYSLLSIIDPTLTYDLDFVYCLSYEDSTKTLWIGTSDGYLMKYNTVSSKLEKILLMQASGERCFSAVKALVKDKSGSIWVGTQSCGLFRLRKEGEEYKVRNHYVSDPANPKSLSWNYINTIHPYNDSIVWIGTYHGGLNKLNIHKQEFTWFTTEEGLPSNTIYGILEEDNGHLWMSSNKGIFTFDPREETVLQCFDISDGLQSDEFNSNAYHKGASGRFYFGGVNGINYFYPDSIKKNPYLPPVVFTDFYLNDTIVPTGKFPLEVAIDRTDKITLPYDKNSFGFKFAALNYNTPEKNQYAYKMEGLYDDWIEIGTRRMASFTDLSPGAYTFLVKGSNNDGVWNEKPRAINVIITPPWWMTWYMYIIYGLVFLSIVYSIYQFQLQGTLAQREAEQLRELDERKSNLYTNITHEFRTPLSIIIANARKIESWLPASARKNFREPLDMIIRNSNNLVTLISQILDLAALEERQMKIDWTHGDVIHYLKHLGESFESLANSQNIHFSVSCESETLHMDYDKDKMLAIVSNILSNAIKHTQEGDKVFFNIKEEARNGRPYLVMKFRDTGAGIPESELDKIFDKFYQLKTPQQKSSAGTGIGLALTKETVALLGGSITVRSEYGKESEFTVSLPVYRKHREAAGKQAPEIIPVPVFQKPATEKLQDTISGDCDAPIVLIIEDNEDLLTYLFHHFSDDYEVALARNGQEGIAKAIELIPDIIISDVMMPEKDGFEVCETLTRDERTCHIPIILLTAKVTKADKMKGLGTGAIHYLTKPFAEDELDAIIQNLLNLRENIHKEFRQRTEDNAYDDQISGREKAFLSKACQVIEAHLNDEKLNPDFLARQLNISPSQLYRKLKSITGMSIAIFIRDYRLLQAKKLLLSSGLNVTQVGFEVGFNSPEYFSKCFKKKFGFPPSSLSDH